MGTVTAKRTPARVDGSVLKRVLQEGYGPGAWHGPDLRAALAGVAAAEALWRPSPERHNIAEIALHHAFYVHSVRGRLSERDIEPFALDGDDWFPVRPDFGLDWPGIVDLLETEQARLAETIASLGGNGSASTLTDLERLEVVLGITCHAVYHAGQVQLLKKLQGQVA